MKSEAIKQLGIYLISESQHDSMNTVVNLRYKVQWSKKLDIKKANQPVAIRFILTKGSLYAFRIAD